MGVTLQLNWEHEGVKRGMSPDSESSLVIYNNFLMDYLALTFRQSVINMSEDICGTQEL